MKTIVRQDKISLSNDAKTKDFLWINASNRALPFICPDLCVSGKYNIYSKDPNGSFIWDLVSDRPD